MKVLLIGSGGREHALAWALSSSALLDRLWCAPGNAGIAELADCVPLDIADHAAIAGFCADEGIDLVVIGPEAPLAAGLVDDLTARGIAAFGPTRDAARLESSKAFAKDFCVRHGIPTAGHRQFSDAAKARAYIAERGAPIVVKADGLAAGKGVVVAETVEEACSAVDALLSGGLGEAGASVVIEEFLVGEEASYFALCDGETALALASAQDHKRAYDGDVGPNTGGMGAFSPAPPMTDAMMARVHEEIIRPTVAGMRAEGTPFVGVLYAGLMITASGPKLIEFNVRFGDPEAQVLVMRLRDDLLLLLQAAVDGALATMSVRWRAEAALTVVLAAHGYPGPYETGSVIRNVDEAAAMQDIEVFHAGTRRENGELVAAGGRVLGVTALGRDVREANARAYAAIDVIDWPGGYWRRDIGWRAVKSEAG